MNPRPRSARLTIEEAQAIAPEILKGRSPQVRKNWDDRGVAWEALGPLLVARVKQATQPGTASRVQSLPTRPTLPGLTEEMVSDKTFMTVWARLSAIYRARHTTHRDEWEALATNLKAFAKGLAADEMRRPKRREGDEK